MAEVRRRVLRLLGVAAALTLWVTPVPAVATEVAAAPVTVPALADWAPEKGSYTFGAGTWLVADTPAGCRVAATLADDLRSAGHGSVPVVRGGARADTGSSAPSPG
ncbi:hypothetical protein [Streptomyces sp. NPDC087294]|uniref:hypothetical protein n=1 Tax=Streptomyces sp. NPDC087294 TaxID=3365777 RepID=UPI00380AE36A